jgi:arsenate reductase
MILQSLNSTITKLKSEFDKIPLERKSLLAELTNFIKAKSESGQPINLNFICTHNSRRSHLAQLWAQVAAYNYGVKSVQSFSGGTEATAFNPRAVKAMKEAGFNITMLQAGDNPVYEVRFAADANPVEAFSKKYDDAANPTKDFAAIMTCSHADQNCPVVIGASKRIALTYDDPKDFDGTAREAEKYAERVREIGREILYAFSQVR